MTQSVATDKPHTIGQRIRQARKEAGLSTTRLAFALEVDPRTVARWQSDDSLPSVLKLGELARVLGKPPSYFLDGEVKAA